MMRLDLTWHEASTLRGLLAFWIDKHDVALEFERTLAGIHARLDAAMKEESDADSA